MTTTPNTTASGAADDSLLLCALDLHHSAIYDNPHEMVDCVRAVADRITALAASAPVAPAPEPAPINPRTQYLTVVYRGVEAGDEARVICDHPKVSAVSWSHALDDRDAALAAAPKAAPAINKVSDIIDAYGMTPGQPERVADIPGLAEALEAAFADGSAKVTGATPGEYLPLQGLAAYLRAEAVGVTGVPRETLRSWANEVDAAARGAAQAAPAEIDAKSFQSYAETRAYSKGYYAGKKAAQAAPAPVSKSFDEWLEKQFEFRNYYFDLRGPGLMAVPFARRAYEAGRAPVAEDAIALLSEVAHYFTGDDDLPNDLLPRIDALLDAQAAQPEGGA